MTPPSSPPNFFPFPGTEPLVTPLESLFPNLPFTDLFNRNISVEKQCLDYFQCVDQYREIVKAGERYVQFYHAPPMFCAPPKFDIREVEESSSLADKLLVGLARYQQVSLLGRAEQSVQKRDAMQASLYFMMSSNFEMRADHYAAETVCRRYPQVRPLIPGASL